MFAAVAAPVASAFVTDFDSYATGTLVGQDNWVGSASAASYADVGPGYISGQSFTFGYADSSPTEPTETTVTVGNSGYNYFLAGTQAIFDFRIIDENNTNTAADRYGFTLSSGGNLLSIYLSPANSGPRPGNPEVVARWELGYALNGGEYTKFSEDINVFEDNLWNFNLTATANTGNPLLTDFAITITGASTATANLIGTSFSPTTNVDSFGFSWDKSGATFTNDYIAIDNLSVVPEPSSALLLGGAGLGLIIRRRRA